MNFTTYLLIATLILAAAVVFWLTDAARVLFQYRGKMLFTCPETGKAACVKVATTAAACSSLTGRPRVRLSECSRWPERRNCEQDCLSQLGADPQNCCVWTKVSDWYVGRTCAYCHKPFLELHWHDHRPALLGPQGKLQWSDVAAEKLPEIFKTHLPVCWSCYIAQTFRRQYPDRVVDRPGHRGPMSELLREHKRDERADTIGHS